jgi:Protein of unknown function (DUF2442)
MSALVRVTEVHHLGERVLRVTFSDGLVRELDFADALPGLFAALDDDAAFGAVTLDSRAGTVCWPGGIDLDPDVLYGHRDTASPVRPRVVREYRLQQTS